MNDRHTYTFKPLTEDDCSKHRFSPSTLSVGICPLVATTTGKERLGKAVKRFRGDASRWQEINAVCAAFCEALNLLPSREAQEAAIQQSVAQCGFRESIPAEALQVLVQVAAWWSGTHPIERGKGFEAQLARIGDAYAPMRDKDWRDYAESFVNDVFEIHPYCWCENEDCPQCGNGEQANFFYKPTGLKINWNKYPLRDAYSNQPITVEQFAQIADRCILSVKPNAIVTGAEPAGGASGGRTG